MTVTSVTVSKQAGFYFQIPPLQFDGTFDANLKAAFVVGQCAARKMVSEKKGGSIVNVSSQASMKAIPEHAFYAASKAAMDMMTKVMALELGKHNVSQARHCCLLITSLF